MGTYKSRRHKENRMRQKIRLEALKNADEFAKMTFIQLRKEDTTWKRILRYLRIIPQQKVE